MKWSKISENGTIYFSEQWNQWKGWIPFYEFEIQIERAFWTNSKFRQSSRQLNSRILFVKKETKSRECERQRAQDLLPWPKREKLVNPRIVDKRKTQKKKSRVEMKYNARLECDVNESFTSFSGESKWRQAKVIKMPSTTLSPSTLNFRFSFMIVFFLRSFCCQLWLSSDEQKAAKIIKIHEAIVFNALNWQHFATWRHSFHFQYEKFLPFSNVCFTSKDSWFSICIVCNLTLGRREEEKKCEQKTHSLRSCGNIWQDYKRLKA